MTDRLIVRAHFISLLIELPFPEIRWEVLRRVNKEYRAVQNLPQFDHSLFDRHMKRVSEGVSMEGEEMPFANIHISILLMILAAVQRIINKVMVKKISTDIRDIRGHVKLPFISGVPVKRRRQ